MRGCWPQRAWAFCTLRRRESAVHVQQPWKDEAPADLHTESLALASASAACVPFQSARDVAASVQIVPRRWCLP
eukprot:6190701-Pleurochrysis_carterae.AAC.3